MDEQSHAAGIHARAIEEIAGPDDDAFLRRLLRRQNLGCEQAIADLEYDIGEGAPDIRRQPNASVPYRHLVASLRDNLTGELISEAAPGRLYITTNH